MVRILASNQFLCRPHPLPEFHGMRLFDNESDLTDPQGKILCRAYGIIVVKNGEFSCIKFKPWPKIISSLEVGILGTRTHSSGVQQDRCLLYYNQPFFHKRYLALKYVVSNRGTSFRSFRLATRVLDEVARIKQSNAIVCEVTNPSISNRLLKRWGWEKHLNDHPSRNFIKRFYGEYPASIVEDELETAS